jgi:two-component system, NtrC family, nitrogen regulation response regulator NtrX
MTARQVLVVDDEVGIRELLNDILLDEGYQVKLAENAAQAREMRQKNRPDLVLLDIWMPDCDGVTLLKEWGNGGLLTMPVVMMSGHGTIDTAVEATRIGAFDFLEKPIALQKLLKTVNAALKYSEQLPKPDISVINLGKSVVINELRQRLEQVAKMNAPLLLIGPKGSGSELCAKFMHKPNTPWLALHDNNKLAESPIELLENVENGQVFIAEVGNLNKTEQKGLYLLLSKAERHNVRVVCSTALALDQMVAQGQFDEALFKVLSVATLPVPSLEDHPEDIPELARAMATMLVENHETTYREFDTAALNTLRNASWPGNLEQLENAVRNLMQTSLGEKITHDDVMRVLRQFETMSDAQHNHIPFDMNKPLRDARDDFERAYFEYHLNKASGNMSKLAEYVQLERTHLYRKLKQLGIKAK